MLWALVLLVGALALALFLLGGFQRSVLFPTHLIPRSGPPPPPDAVIARLEAGGDRIEAWLLPATGPGPASGRRPLLLFAHGNGELIDFWPAAFEEPRRWGCAVLLVEYPGYGRSSGRPAERSIRQAMEAAYDWAAERPEVDPERIVGYGRSVGGGAIGLLARSRPLAALVLESSFTSVAGMARRMGFPGLLVRDRFDTLEVVRGFEGPILLVHGERDEIIPADESRRLAAAARDAELHLIPCGHNDCPRPWDELERFLRARGILESPPLPSGDASRSPSGEREPSQKLP